MIFAISLPSFHNVVFVVSWPTWEQGDVIGCGFVADNKSIFFTRNGSLLGDAVEGIKELVLSPLVMFGSTCRSTDLEINFGTKPFLYRGNQVRLDTKLQEFAKYCEGKANTSWLKILNAEILSLRLLVARSRVSCEFREGKSTSLSRKFHTWMESVMFFRGRVGDDSSDANEGLEMLKRLSIDAYDESCKSFLEKLPKLVNRHPVGQAIHAVGDSAI